MLLPQWLHKPPKTTNSLAGWGVFWWLGFKQLFSLWCVTLHAKRYTCMNKYTIYPNWWYVCVCMCMYDLIFLNIINCQPVRSCVCSHVIAGSLSSPCHCWTNCAMSRIQANVAFGHWDKRKMWTLLVFAFQPLRLSNRALHQGPRGLVCLAGNIPPRRSTWTCLPSRQLQNRKSNIFQTQSCRLSSGTDYMLLLLQVVSIPIYRYVLWVLQDVLNPTSSKMVSPQDWSESVAVTYPIKCVSAMLDYKLRICSVASSFCSSLLWKQSLHANWILNVKSLNSKNGVNWDMV